MTLLQYDKPDKPYYRACHNGACRDRNVLSRTSQSPTCASKPVCFRTALLTGAGACGACKVLACELLALRCQQKPCGRRYTTRCWRGTYCG